mgnify:CR=1 FL=1
MGDIIPSDEYYYMKIKESIIRENISKHISLLDKNLKLVAQEHYIKMPDGKTAFIDILAKDDFGCFTVIELKKATKLHEVQYSNY